MRQCSGAIQSLVQEQFHPTEISSLGAKFDLMCVPSRRVWLMCHLWTRIWKKIKSRVPRNFQMVQNSHNRIRRFKGNSIIPNTCMFEQNKNLGKKFGGGKILGSHLKFRNSWGQKFDHLVANYCGQNFEVKIVGVKILGSKFCGQIWHLRSNGYW